MSEDQNVIKGHVVAELRGPDGELIARHESENLITSTGDQMYASRGAGLVTSATPTGMKLGTGSTAPAKSGAGAAVVTYLTGSNKAFDATFPTAVAGVVTYKRTYAAGEATYAVGDTVTKDGHRWSCLIAHGTERQGTWAPGVAPTVWSDLGPA